MEIFTIGYAGFEIENFIKVLKKYHINSLIDAKRKNINSRQSSHIMQ